VTKTTKPIRVFWSPLTGRFHATQHYRETAPGQVTITGRKWDVTNDIASVITERQITFSTKENADGE